MMLSKIILASAFLFEWDLPYPTCSPDPCVPVVALGVRCYYRITPATQWTLLDEVATNGKCDRTQTLVGIGKHEFVARGYNEVGESGDSNVVEMCFATTLAQVAACFGVDICSNSNWGVCCGPEDDPCVTMCMMVPDGCQPLILQRSDGGVYIRIIKEVE